MKERLSLLTCLKWSMPERAWRKAAGVPARQRRATFISNVQVIPISNKPYYKVPRQNQTINRL